MKFIAILGAFLLHQTLSCEACGCGDVDCKNDEVLEKPSHRIENFDISEKHRDLKDFQIKDPKRTPEVCDDHERREENEERYERNQAKLANWKHEAREQSQNRLRNAHEYADASAEELREIKLKKVDLPTIRTEIRRPIYYRPEKPELRKPSAPKREERARPYKFNEPVCGKLNCKPCSYKDKE